MMHQDDLIQLMNDYLHPCGLGVIDFDSLQDAARFINQNIPWAQMIDIDGEFD
ncbi:hypothetical protein NIES4101_74100 [Calothrix sp. NIES-4101]|nr:hypothetical protein NIES4101_74100 [Calothrix sp. NIES-4101]